MWQSITAFLPTADFAWYTQLAILSAAWIILGQPYPLRKHLRPRLLPEFLLLFLCINLVTLLAIGLNGVLGGGFLLLRLFGQGLVTAGYMYRFGAGKRRTRLVLWLALTTAGMSITHFGGQASMLMGQYIAKGLAEAMTRIGVDLFLIVTAVYLRRFQFDDYPDVPANGLWMLGCNTLCVIMLYVAESLMPRDGDSGVTVVFFLSYLSMLVMMLVCVRGLFSLCRQQKTVTDLQTEKQRFLSEREQSRVAESMLRSLRAIRHDLKNQYAYMRILLAEKRYDELEKYFEALQEQLPTQMNIVDCGNRTVNTVLNMEFSKLRNERITLEHQLVVPPVLPFRDEDLTAILTNLLDNAGEECRRLLREGREKSWVRLEIYPHQSYLYIRCLNSTDRTSLERSRNGLRTTKQDEELHGYGTQIITKLAEKYNGLADFAAGDGTFTAKVMLDMNMEGNA